MSSGGVVMQTVLDGFVSMAGIAEITGLQYQTIRVYRTRDKLPKPDMTIDGKPLWRLSTIEAWERERLKRPDMTTGR